MKKITLFILTIFTVATLYAAARPSLDGRAVVAESGTMPRGLFARTVGYLPGDSVTVTNPATGSTVDVLILGAIDPSEGVAILLSPEAAEGLRIRPDSNVQVKLTKRAGSLDENANGSAVLTEDDDSDETAEIASSLPDESNMNYSESNAPAVTTKKEINRATIVPDDSYTEPESDKNDIIEEYPAVPETKTPTYAEAVPYEEPVRITKTPTETMYEVVPPLPSDNERVEPVEKIEVVNNENDDEMQKVVLIESENEPTEEQVPFEEEIVEEIAASEPVLAEEKVLPANEDERLQQVIVVPVENQIAESEPLPPVIEELPVDYEYATSEWVEEEPVAEELPDGIETEPEVELAYYYDDELSDYGDDESSDYDEGDGDAYKPIVLVPTDENPPIADETEENTEEFIAETEESDEEFIAVSEENFDEMEVVPSSVSENSVVSNDWTNYTVPSFNNLRSGYYYIQIASLGNPENITSIVDTYSNKYPIVLVQNATKTNYQVMVGPLTIDEYGSVNEKFQSYGFKDAFVRKIK